MRPAVICGLVVEYGHHCFQRFVIGLRYNGYLLLESRRLIKSYQRNGGLPRRKSNHDGKVARLTLIAQAQQSTYIHV